MKAKSNRGEVKARVWGNYLELGDSTAGEKLEVSYPLPIREEEVAIGNPGFRQYRYRVTWKGDTVVRMTPIGEPPKNGLFRLRQQARQGLLREEGPGPLYQRDFMLKDGEPRPTPLHMDDGLLDFWYLR